MWNYYSVSRWWNCIALFSLLILLIVHLSIIELSCQYIIFSYLYIMLHLYLVRLLYHSSGASYHNSLEHPQQFPYPCRTSKLKQVARHTRRPSCFSIFHPLKASSTSFLVTTFRGPSTDPSSPNSLIFTIQKFLEIAPTLLLPLLPP